MTMEFYTSLYIRVFKSNTNIVDWINKEKFGLIQILVLIIS